MKKNSGTDILSHLSEEELQRIMSLKSGLEDLNLIMQEIENTYNKLSETGLTEADKKNQRLRLLSLEQFLTDTNAKVNTALGSEDNKLKLS